MTLLKKLSVCISVAGLALMFAASPAQAQYNAFKDPSASGIAASSSGAPDFKAVETDMKGGKMAVGATAYVVILFKNQGSALVTVGKVNLYPSSNVNAAVAQNQCATAPLAADAQCAITISIKGLMAGSWRVDALIDHDGRSRLATASISGEVEPAPAQKDDTKGDVEISPVSLDFGTSPGGIAMVRPVTLKNRTAETIKIKDILLDGPDKSGFTFKSQCGDTLKPEETCNIIVTWQPTSKGLAQGVLVVQHSGRNGMVQTEVKGVLQPPPAEAAAKEAAGSVELTPSLDFGTSQGGIALKRSALLSNNSGEDVELWDIGIDVPDGSGFSYDSQCPDTLRPGETCTVVITWQPTAKGLAQGVLIVDHSGKAGMAQAELKGLYQPPAGTAAQDAGGKVSISPENLDFGTSQGGIPVVQSVVISNHLSEAVKIQGVSLDASDKSGFSYKSQCPDMLPPEGLCNVIVTWQPTAKGLAQGVLAIQHSGKGGLVQTGIKGVFTPLASDDKNAAGKVSISPDNLDFGNIDGSIPLVQSVVISNHLAEAIKIENVTLDAPAKAGFSYKSQCPDMLPPEGLCNVIVTWQPTAKGLAQGVLAIQHSGKGGLVQSGIKGIYNPASTDGKDATGKVTLAPEILDFGTSDGGLPLVRSVLLSNQSNEDAEIWDIDMKASDKSGFSTDSQCPDTLKVGESCSIIVTWQPVTKGLAQGVLVVEHSGTAGTAQADVKGLYQPPTITAAAKDSAEGMVRAIPETLDFGTSPGGISLVRSVVLTNDATTNINIKNIILNVPDQSGFSYKSACPQTLEPGQACNVVVTWSPTVKGTAQGVLVIEHTGKRGMTQVDIKGQLAPEAGKGAALYPDVAPDRGLLVSDKDKIEFGSDISKESAITSTLVNAGSSPLTLKSIKLSGVENDLDVTDTGCVPQMTLKPGEACPLTLSWLPSHGGAILDSLQIVHTGTRGVLVIPVTGSADKSLDTTTIVDAAGHVTTVPAGSVGAAGSSASGGSSSLSSVLKAMRQVSADDYTVTSHSSTRAVIDGPKGSLVVRDGEDTFIDGTKYTVAIMSTGVILSTKTGKVTLPFDSSFKLLEPDTSTSTSKAAAGPPPPASKAPPSLLPNIGATP